MHLVCMIVNVNSNIRAALHAVQRRVYDKTKTWWRTTSGPRSPPAVPTATSLTRSCCAAGEPAVHYAAREGCADCVRLLLGHGADIPVGGKVTPLWLAASGGHAEVATLLLKGQRSSVAHNRSFNPTTPLSIACTLGHLEVIKALLRGGVDPNNANETRLEEQYSWSDIEGCGCGECNMYHYSEGRRGPQRVGGSTPLLGASTRGDLAVVQLLLQGSADSNAADLLGNLPLLKAAALGRVEVVKALLVYSARPNVTNQEGLTPLCAVVSFGSLPMVQALLARKARTHKATQASQVPLHVAACAGRGDLVAALLDSGADPNEVDQHGDFALVMAARRGHYQVVQLLLARNATDKTSQSLRFGGTPLAAAAAGLGSAGDANHLWVMHALLAKGAQVNLKDHVGRTALYIAAAQKPAGAALCPPFVLAGIQLLLRQGADMKAVLGMAGRLHQASARARISGCFGERWRAWPQEPSSPSGLDCGLRSVGRWCWRSSQRPHRHRSSRA